MPFEHAESSAKKFGGKAEDYLKIHDLIDSAKASIPDCRHRTVFHSSFGVYIVEQIFGTYITNSDGKKVYTRNIAEQHIIECLGFIPTLQDYIKNMTIEPWMYGALREGFKSEELPEELASDGNKKKSPTESDKVFDSKVKVMPVPDLLIQYPTTIFSYSAGGGNVGVDWGTTVRAEGGVGGVGGGAGAPVPSEGGAGTNGNAGFSVNGFVGGIQHFVSS